MRALYQFMDFGTSVVSIAVLMNVIHVEGDSLTVGLVLLALSELFAIRAKQES